MGHHLLGAAVRRLRRDLDPAASASVINPAQRLDFARFSDESLRRCFVSERDLIRRYAGSTPVTTNFMATSCPGIDYWAWALEVDVVSNDHYLTGGRHDAHVLLAQDLDWRPSVDLDHRERVEAYYTRLWQDKVTVDFAHPEADLSGYRLVIVPQLYLLGAGGAKNPHSYVAGGGHLLVSYFSGVVDAQDAVHEEGLSGPLGKVLGVDVQEMAPLRAGERVTVEPAGDLLVAGFTADVWTEHVSVAADTEVVARFGDGPAAGEPALTCRTIGAGTAWYLATRPDPAGLTVVLDAVYAAAGIVAGRTLVADLDIVERRTAGDRFQFLVNNSVQDVVVATSGVELLTGAAVPDAGQEVPAGTMRVVRRGTP